MTRLAKGLEHGADEQPKCFWCTGHEDYEAYHDSEWGRPVKDDFRLFEKMVLEGFQAGLSWLTILRKRDNFGRAFKRFDFEKVARFTRSDVTRLLLDRGIVRHRGKVEAAVNNAKRAIEVADEFGSLAKYLWCFEPDPLTRPRRLTKQALMKLTEVPESVALSKDLKKRGWRFVGPTTMYALMQSVGMVNDHIEGCSMRDSIEQARDTFKRPK